MVPLLFRIPLPAVRVPLWPLLLALCAVASLAALYAHRRGLRGASQASMGLAAALGMAAFFARGYALALAPLEVSSFGALLALAIGLGALTTLRLAEQSGMSRETAGAVCIEAAIFGVLGARLGYVVLHPDEMDSIARVFAFHDGGLVAHGALIAGAAAAFVATRRQGLSARAWFDAASPAVALGVVLTRVGCWLEGCDFGRPLTSSAPGVLARLGTFPAESHAWVHQVVGRTLSADAPRSLPVHPSQLYEALGGVALLALAVAARRRQMQQATAAIVVFLGYAVLRVLVDFSREPSREVWLGRAVLAVGVGLTLMAFRRARVAV